MKIIEITSLLFEKYIAEKLPTKDQEEEHENNDGTVSSKHPFIGDKVAVFHGPNSKEWDYDMVNLAKKLEKTGATRQSIWKRTGVFRNSNGDWRMEISDYDMAVKRIPQRGEVLKMGDVIDHPELFKAYPLLAKMPIKGYDARDDMFTLGYYDPSVHHIAMRMPDGSQDDGDMALANQRWRRTMAHEIQHAIQAIEKPLSNQWKGDNDKIQADLKRAGIDQTDHQVYKSYWKEIDARLVGGRVEQKPEFNKEFVPVPKDTEFMQVDNERNRPPGDSLSTHHSKYPSHAVGSVTIKNPFYHDNMAPYQNDRDYQHGNSKGAVDDSGLGRSSPYRNKPGHSSNNTSDTVNTSTPVSLAKQPKPTPPKPTPPKVNKQPSDINSGKKK